MLTVCALCNLWDFQSLTKNQSQNSWCATRSIDGGLRSLRCSGGLAVVVVVVVIVGASQMEMTQQVTQVI